MFDYIWTLLKIINVIGVVSSTMLSDNIFTKNSSQWYLYIIIVQNEIIVLYKITLYWSNFST